MLLLSLPSHNVKRLEIKKMMIFFLLPKIEIF